MNARPTSPAKLGVNVDHVATIRQARGTHYPDPVAAAKASIRAGADQITVHLREDRRHIQERDVTRLRQEIDKPLNLEMAATDAMLTLALSLKPDRVTLVPEKRRELTTEGGLDVVRKRRRLRKFHQVLGDGGIHLSVFIDPDQNQVDASLELGIQAIELHTGTYADASSTRTRADEWERLVVASRYASSHHQFVAAGHGLTVENIFDVAKIGEIREFNIGHSLVARAILVGMEEAVREMIAKIAAAHQNAS